MRSYFLLINQYWIWQHMANQNSSDVTTVYTCSHLKTLIDQWESAHCPDYVMTWGPNCSPAISPLIHDFLLFPFRLSSSPSYYELLPLKCPSRKNQRFKLQGSINDCTVGHSTWTKKECKYKIVTFAALVLKLKVTIYCMWTTEGNTLQYQNYWIERWTSFPFVLKEESLETTGSCAIGWYNR